MKISRNDLNILNESLKRWIRLTEGKEDITLDSIKDEIQEQNKNLKGFRISFEDWEFDSEEQYNSWKRTYTKIDLKDKEYKEIKETIEKIKKSLAKNGVTDINVVSVYGGFSRTVKPISCLLKIKFKEEYYSAKIHYFSSSK